VSEIKRKKGESFEGFIRRVKRQWLRSGKLIQAKKVQFYTDTVVYVTVSITQSGSGVIITMSDVASEQDTKLSKQSFRSTGGVRSMVWISFLNASSVAGYNRFIDTLWVRFDKGRVWPF